MIHQGSDLMIWCLCLYGSWQKKIHSNLNVVVETVVMHIAVPHQDTDTEY